MADLIYQPTNILTEVPADGPKTSYPVPIEGISPKDEISKFGCRSKSKVKPGSVRDIIRDLNINISNDKTLGKNDFENDRKEFKSDMQCPLSDNNLNYEPDPIKDRGSGLKNDICLTPPKRIKFKQLRLKKSIMNLNESDCHTQPQLNTEIKSVLNNAKDCHTQPKPENVKTPLKNRNNKSSINIILKPSPKAKSIKKPRKSKVSDIIREFEGRSANNASKPSPLGKDRKFRVGRKGNSKRFEALSNQPDIRTFMERAQNRDMTPTTDRVNDS